LMLLWLEYREAHPDEGYAYSQFCELYREWPRHLDVVMRQLHRPGEKLFVDFAGQTIPIHDPATDEITLRAELFVAVTGKDAYSSAGVIAITPEHVNGRTDSTTHLDERDLSAA
jgi:transposase